MYMHRAHRLGRFTLNKTRPIIVAFRDFGDTETIMSHAKKLQGTQFGISRDYPSEIVKARQKLWPEFKRFKQEAGPSDRISISYPAKLIVNKEVKTDLFPDWNRIMKGSRVSVTASNGSSENSVVMNSQPRPYKPNEGPTLRSNDNYLKPTTSASRHSWGDPNRFCDVSESYTFTLGQDSDTDTDSDAGSDQAQMDYCETTGRSETNGKNENIIPGDKSTYKEHISSLSNNPVDVAEELLRECLKRPQCRQRQTYKMIELILLSTTVKTASKNSKRFKGYRSFKIGF